MGHYQSANLQQCYQIHLTVYLLHVRWYFFSTALGCFSFSVLYIFTHEYVCPYNCHERITQKDFYRVTQTISVAQNAVAVKMRNAFCFIDWLFASKPALFYQLIGWHACHFNLVAEVHLAPLGLDAKYKKEVLT